MPAKQQDDTEETQNLPAVPDFTPQDLKNITSLQDALALMSDKGMAPVVTAADEIGDGFSVLTKDEKAKLVGEMCLFVKWDFHLGDMGEFVTAHVVTSKGDKWILNDGSTGIYQQLREMSDDTGRMGGLMVHKGLRESNYLTTVPDPKEPGETMEIPATTYYIDTSQ